MLTHKSHFNVFLNTYCFLWSILGGDIIYSKEDSKDYIAAYRFFFSQDGTSGDLEFFLPFICGVLCWFFSVCK